MASTLYNTAQKFIKALNANGYRLIFHNKEFMDKQGTIHKLYSINQARWNDERERFDNVELYATASIYRIVMFLRDLWYDFKGWELPTNDEKWNEIREQLRKED